MKRRDAEETRRRRGQSVWAFIAFLALFVVLLLIVCHWYLLPALGVFYDKGIDKAGKQLLSAQAMLLMTLLLLIFGAMMLLLFRLGRIFFPRPWKKRTQTKYVDAWAEAGKRFKEPKDN
jgi:hypothetical protein